MNKLNRFHILIQDGKMLFKSPEHEQMFKKFLAQWNNQFIELAVFEKKKKRSYQQNAYYWFYLNMIADNTGEDAEVLHNYFRNKFLTKGFTELYGNRVRIAKSTTELTVGEFCNYLVEISALTQIELPDTTAYWGYSYHK